jgi:ribosomal protein S18 acetylase RimI-like enzyme
MATRVVALTDAPREVLLNVFNRAFRDYLLPVSLDDEGLKSYTEANDIQLGNSFLAYDGEVPVGFTFTGVRGFRSWVGGLGVVPELRGHGHGKFLLEAQIERLDELDMDDVTLECFVDNAVALGMYKKHGFKKVRSVRFLQHDRADELAQGRTVTEGSVGDMTVSKCAIKDLRDYYPKGHTWPKTFESILRTDGAEAVAGTKGTSLKGYLIYIPLGSNIYLLDLTPDRYGIDLLAWVVKTCSPRSLHISNVHDPGLLKVLQKAGFLISHTLDEMRRPIKKKGFLW